MLFIALNAVNKPSAVFIPFYFVPESDFVPSWGPIWCGSFRLTHHLYLSIYGCGNFYATLSCPPLGDLNVFGSQLDADVRSLMLYGHDSRRACPIERVEHDATLGDPARMQISGSSGGKTAKWASLQGFGVIVQTERRLRVAEIAIVLPPSFRLLFPSDFGPNDLVSPAPTAGSLIASAS